MVWAPDYVTTDEAKAYLRVTDDVDDDELDLIVSAASRAIDKRCNRQFGKVATAEQRFYTARYSRTRQRWVVEIDDLMTTTDFAAEVTDVGTLTAYTLEPRNAAAKGRPWERLVVDADSAVMPTGEEFEMDLTGLWGWTAVPNTVKAAARIQINRFLSRRDSPYGVAGSPSEGSELRLLAKLDPDVETMVSTLARVWGAR